MSKIIVGVDESDRSTDAVALAAQLAGGSDAELVLACAYPYDDVSFRGANAEYRRYLREDAESTLESARAQIAGMPRVRWVTVADTSPARAIQAVAANEGASLIVIGSSHRGAVGRVLAGTTAERLLHGAPCPVAVAPREFAAREARAVESVAVGYDGSAEAKAALRGAASIASALGARLRLLKVLDATWLGTPALMAGPGYIQTPDELMARARRHLAETAAELPDDVPVEPVVVVADPERMLAEESGHVDLIVVGSRGYGPHRAVLLGSVSGRLVRDAACPVIVVPRGVEAPLEDLFRTPSPTKAA